MEKIMEQQISMNLGQPYDLSEFNGKVISYSPYVKLLQTPKFSFERNRWEALAQVNEMLAFVEVNVKALPSAS
jgi:hypothetical protein